MPNAAFDGAECEIGRLAVVPRRDRFDDGDNSITCARRIVLVIFFILVAVLIVISRSVRCVRLGFDRWLVAASSKCEGLHEQANQEKSLHMPPLLKMIFIIIAERVRIGKGVS